MNSVNKKDMKKQEIDVEKAGKKIWIKLQLKNPFIASISLHSCLKSSPYRDRTDFNLPPCVRGSSAWSHRGWRQHMLAEYTEKAFHDPLLLSLQDTKTLLKYTQIYCSCIFSSKFLRMYSKIARMVQAIWLLLMSGSRLFQGLPFLFLGGWSMEDSYQSVELMWPSNKLSAEETDMTLLVWQVMHHHVPNWNLLQLSSLY